MKPIILSILLAIASIISYSQNTDSVQYYELEPTELTHKVGEVDYQILNYFSTKTNLTTRHRNPFHICCQEPKVSNYGVELSIPKNSNTIFVKNIIFEAAYWDTVSIPHASFFIKVQHGNGKITSLPIKVKHYSWVNYKEQRVQVYNTDSFKVTPNKLVEIVFELEEIKIAQGDKIFLFREDQKPYNGQSSLIWSKLKKQNTYYEKDGTIYPLQFSFADKMMKNVAWQVRVQYRAYHKAEN